MIPWQAVILLLVVIPITQIQNSEFEIPNSQTYFVDTTLNAYATSILSLSDNGWIIAGSTADNLRLDSTNLSILPENFILARYNSTGTRLWSTTYNTGGSSVLKDLTILNDTVYAVGYSEDNNGTSTAYILSLTLDGQLKTITTLTKPSLLSGITHTNNEIEAVGGIALNNSLKPLLVKFNPNNSTNTINIFANNSNNNLLWTKIIPITTGYATSGSLGPPPGRGGCINEILNSTFQILNTTCDLGNSSAYFGITTINNNIITAGYNAYGSSAAATVTSYVNNTITWRNTIGSNITQYRAFAITSDGNNTLATIANGTPVVNSLFVNPNQITQPLLSVINILYDNNGTQLYYNEFRQNNYQILPLANTYSKQGYYLITGSQSDPLSLNVHPFVLKLIINN